jgi:hypothetical protein
MFEYRECMETHSFPEHFRETTAEYADRPAAIDLRRTFSHSELDALYLGIQKAGTSVGVPINLLLNPEEVQYILTDAEAKTRVCCDHFASTVTTARACLPDIETFICVGKKPSNPADLVFKELFQSEIANRKSEIDPSAIAVIIDISRTIGEICVRGVAGIGQPHKQHGEIPVGYLTIKENHPCSERDIRAFCLQASGTAWGSRKNGFYERTPEKNAAGKIVKRKLTYGIQH